MRRSGRNEKGLFSPFRNGLERGLFLVRSSIDLSELQLKELELDNLYGSFFWKTLYNKTAGIAKEGAREQLPRKLPSCPQQIYLTNFC